MIEPNNSAVRSGLTTTSGERFISRSGRTVVEKWVEAGGFVRGNQPSWQLARERSEFGPITRSRSAMVRDGPISGTLDGFVTASGTSMCRTYDGIGIMIVMILINIRIEEQGQTT